MPQRFDEVTGVIFVAAISEYDQVLFEDKSQNRMIEAIALFREVCNLKWFRKTAMILFLNKRDLFEAKHVLSIVFFCFGFHCCSCRRAVIH